MQREHGSIAKARAASCNKVFLAEANSSRHVMLSVTLHTAVGFFQSDEQEELSDLSEISTPALTNGLFPPPSLLPF